MLGESEDDPEKFIRCMELVLLLFELGKWWCLFRWKLDEGPTEPLLNRFSLRNSLRDLRLSACASAFCWFLRLESDPPPFSREDWKMLLGRLNLSTWSPSPTGRRTGEITTALFARCPFRPRARPLSLVGELDAEPAPPPSHNVPELKGLAFSKPPAEDPYENPSAGR